MRCFCLFMHLAHVIFIATLSTLISALYLFIYATSFVYARK